MLAPWKKSYDQPRQHIKKQRHHFASKGPSARSYGFSSSHIWMWELNSKQDWTLKNWCFWTVVLEKTLESPLDSKEIQPVNPKGNQPWIFPGRTERLKAGGEGDERGQDGWMASLTRWTWVWASPGDGEGQGSLAFCSPWGHKESDTTEWLNRTELSLFPILSHRKAGGIGTSFIHAFTP